MIGGFLFTFQFQANQANEDLLKLLGPQHAHYASKKVSNETWMGQMSLSFYTAAITQKNHFSLIGSCLLNNRKELLNTLQIQDSFVSDQQIILHAYQKWGTGLVKHLNGQFAFVIWDNENQKVFAANSPSGSAKLLYYRNGEHLVIASEAKCIFPFLKQRKFRQDFIISFVEDLMAEPYGSLYEDILHLPHGYALEWSTNSFKQWQYYIPGQIDKIRFKRPEEYAEAGNALVSEIMKGYLDSGLKPGIQMGGGLSSSLIAWNLREFAGKNVNAVSYILPQNYTGNYKDEKHLTDILKEHLQLNLHYVNETVFPDPYGDHIEKKFWEQDSMHANPIGSDHEVVYGKLKKLETQLIFTSGGKNFTWNAADLPAEYFLRGKWLSLLKAGKLKKGFAEALPKTILQKILEIKNGKNNSSILHSEIMNADELRAYTYEIFNALPRKSPWLTSSQDQLIKTSSWVYGMKKYMSAQERRYDMAFVNPLSDHRLLDFSCAIPTEQHLHRAFSKNMLKHKVPQEIWSNAVPYSYPADMGDRWMNLRKHLDEHFLTIPEKDEVWQYINREKVQAIYQKIKQEDNYAYWRKNRAKINKVVILSRFLKWSKKQF